MKKLLIIAALFAGVYNTALAQDQKGRSDRKSMTTEERAKLKTEKLSEALQLSAAQKKAVYELQLQEMHQMKEGRKEDMEAMQAARKAREDRMKAILTPEQAAKFQKMQAERIGGDRKRQHVKHMDVTQPDSRVNQGNDIKKESVK